MTTYDVWTEDVNGKWHQYIGEDREAFEAAIAKLEAWNERARASKSPWGPKVREYFTQITEDEPETPTAAKQQDGISNATILRELGYDPDEQANAKAPVAPYRPRKGDPSDDYEAHVRQFNGTRISDFRSDKPWAVFVESNRRTGGRLSTTNIYDFATLEEAKASIAYHTGHCSGATIYGRSGTCPENYGSWVSWRSQAGCHYDQYDEYCKKWSAGAFDAAFERDEILRDYHAGRAAR